MPSLRIRAYPTQVRYGLVWVFPGDPALASLRSLPEVPELEGADPWAYVPHSFTWRAHHSMVIDNLCDLTHAHLHRSFPSFQPGRLISSEAGPDRVVMRYEAKVGPLVRARAILPSVLEICYDYPYHRARFEWSGIGGRITYWTFLLPIDATTTRVFFMFCYDRLRIPWVPFPVGHRLLTALLRLGNTIVRPLLDQDGFALEAEQRGYEAHPDAPLIELNPVGGAPPPPDGQEVGGASQRRAGVRAGTGGRRHVSDLASAAELRGRRERVRAAGLDPDYWYAVEYDGAVRPGQVVEVTFWGESIALYRGADGALRALENRCAHRQLKLSLGAVTGCPLTCAYHGWAYAQDGRLSAIPHDLFGRPFPSVRLRAYPVRVRYGLDLALPRRPGARRPARASPTSRSSRGPTGGRASPRLPLAGAPLDDHRQRERLHACLAAPEVPAVRRREADALRGGRRPRAAELRHADRHGPHLPPLRRSPPRAHRLHRALLRVPVPVVGHRREDQALVLRAADRRARRAVSSSSSTSSRSRSR